MMTEEKIFQCPVCKHHNHKLYVNVDKGVMNCFHCGFAGPISKLKNYPAIYSQVEDRESLAVFNKLKQDRVREYKQNSELLKELRPFREIEVEDPQFDYLLSRGWDQDIIDCYDVLVSDNEHYSDRVFITVNDDMDNTVFYTGRTILKGVLPKYLNSVAKKDFVFKAVTPVDEFYPENAYICEGIFDAFKLPGGVALLGKTLGKDQHASMFAALRSKKRIYICLDPGTDRETKTLAKELDSWFPNKEIYTIQWGTETDIDVGDLSSRMSRTDVMSYVHSHSNLFTNKFF
jgi:transcription elongation factor Elf1